MRKGGGWVGLVAKRDVTVGISPDGLFFVFINKIGVVLCLITLLRNIFHTTSIDKVDPIWTND